MKPFQKAFVALASVCALGCGLKVTEILKKSITLMPPIEVNVSAPRPASERADARREATKHTVNADDVAGSDNADDAAGSDENEPSNDSESQGEPWLGDLCQ